MKRRILAIFAVLALLAGAAVAVYAETGTVTITGGVLSVTPANVTMSAITLDGTDQLSTSAAASNNWSATDATATGAGWNVTIISTDFGIDEVQQVDIGTSTGGTFTLTFSGQTTASIAYNASAATVESSLEALSNITDVTVTGTGTSGDPWVVTFVDPGKQNVAEMTSTDSLTGGSSTISTTTQGRTIDISSVDQEFKIQLLDANITVTSGNTKPTSTVTTLTAIPETASPLKFVSAALDEGMGTYAINPNFELEVPADTFAGTYTAIFTVAIVSGP